MKTTVIYHSADFDGIFCREIARRFLPAADFIGWDFGDKPMMAELPKEGTIYILDLPVAEVLGIKAAEMNPIEDLNRLTWIDHHKTAIESHPEDIPGYRIDGVAACRLAWQWFSRNAERGMQNAELPTREDYIERQVNEPLSVRLAGEYDIWDKRDANAEVFQHGLRSMDLEGQWETLLSETIYGTELVQQLLGRGEIAQTAQKRNDASLVRHRSFEVKFEGKLFLALNTARCNSLTFEAGVKPEHDGLLGFFWNGKVWKVSLYGVPHKPDLDLSAIAKKYGGGGHKQACGFETEKMPFIKVQQEETDGTESGKKINQKQRKERDE